MGLRQLDSRLLPVLAAQLRALLDGLRGGSRRTPRRGPLRRLDDRFASRGPLALVRDVPQVGVLLASVVFLAAAGVALAKNSPDSVRERERAAAEADLPRALGPPVGVDINGWFSDARARATNLSRQEPDSRDLALVSLSRQVSPEGVATLLEGSKLTVRRVYLRAPVEGAEVLPVDVRPKELVAELESVFSMTAQRRAEEQRARLEQADGLAADDPFRETFEKDARTAGLEAAAFRTPCACAFALVVEGSSRELAELPALPVVRGVEIAPRGVPLDKLDVLPVRPDITGVRPAVPPAGS